MLPNHGANPQLLFEQLKIPMPEKMIDFSENVNFAKMPLPIQQNWASYLPLLEKYPHPKGEPFLSEIAKYHQVKKEMVFVGNGAAEIFTLLANFFTKKKVIIVHPTFSEYESTLAAQEADIFHLEVERIEDWSLPMYRILQQMKKADAIYLCTPNNPTGVLPPREQLEEIIAQSKKNKCYVILDEAFIDWIDEKYSFIDEVEKNPYLIITRSMTKMYSLAGIRLGYAVASEEIVETLQRFAPHWHVNALAAAIGVDCLAQEEYRNVSIEQAIVQRKKFEKFLHNLNCKTTKSETNYSCFQLPDVTKSRDFYLDMLLQGIVVRHTENYRGLNGEWFRVGMKTSDQMHYLQQEMKKWFVRNGLL